LRYVGRVLDFRRCFVKVGVGSSVLFFYRVDFYTPFGVLFLWVVTGSCAVQCRGGVVDSVLCSREDQCFHHHCRGSWGVDDFGRDRFYVTNLSAITCVFWCVGIGYLLEILNVCVKNCVNQEYNSVMSRAHSMGGIASLEMSLEGDTVA
jgi:hypothetical protein